MAEAFEIPKKPKKLHGFRSLFRVMAGTISLENGDSSPTDPLTMKHMRKKGLPWIIAAFIAVLLVLLILLFMFLPKELFGNKSALSGGKSIESLTKSDWIQPKSNSLEARFTKAAIASDNALCSEIGRNVLQRGGNAVDAAIATTACVGALNAHSSGIGGGFIMVMYNKDTGKCTTLDAREVAPLSTHAETFVQNPKNAFYGYKAVGVPGEIHGYWTAFKRYGSGRVAWQDLLMPTVHLLNNGYPVSKLMQVTLESVRSKILTEDGQSMRFFYRNETGEDSFVQEGELLKNPQLAETYRKLAVSSDPVRLFYGGELAKQIDEEFQKYEGYITKKDLEAYRSIIDEKPLYNDHFDEDYAMCGSKPTSGFAVTQLIVSLVSKFYPRGSNQNVLFTSDDYFHKLVESQKFAYALRTRLGDPNFVQEAGELAEKMTQKDFIEKIVEKIKDEALPLEDYGPEFGQPNDMGTSHVSIVNENLAISLTSSINNRFGSLRRSERLGIIWNNHMDDFSVPGAKNFYGFNPSKDNFIQPGKRPLSSMSPLVIFNKHTKEIKAAIGASGGSKIISATAQVVLNVLNFNLTVKEAVDFPRIHNQFTPIRTEFENGFPEAMVEALQNRGHNMTDMTFPITFVQAVFRDSTGALTANNDYRRMVYMYPTGY